jgi:8-oxo-dGTP pyrophosphatase MutT (NUDIX family)/phosphohistidine phosphatase SixA
VAGCLETPPEGRGQSLLVSDPIKAAGGVVRRRGEVLLVHRPKYGDWTFPKGKAKAGESDEECALREVEEETGLRCRLIRELTTTRYRALAGPKVVRYWEMAPLDGEFRPTAEVDEIRWLPPRRAAALLSYARDGDVLASLGPPPLLVVRHAWAGDSEKWVGDDRLRPLDEKGRRQSEELVRTLEPYAVERILSSPLVRCVQTVEPLAAARGLDVETTDVLADGAGADGVRRLLGELAGSPVLLCGHGAEIEELFGKTKKGETRVLDPELRSAALI